VSWWAEATDGGMESEHFVSRRVARIVGVEAAVDLVAAREQSAEPPWIGPDARRRDAGAVGVELKTAY
jgi:hypothetical protein